MVTQIPENPEVIVTVDKVVYMPDLQAPDSFPFPYVYFISITNHTSLPVTIVGRKWVLEMKNGHVTVVEGTGVVGQSPVIPPGEFFSYNSYHVISMATTATGAFFGLDAHGHPFSTRIPSFHMDPLQ